ncbi:vertebrate gliacolin-like protein [Daphnia sinensis]|uniref:Vertebrate gliacolin-like protein n=1 Tax=Daphnia sinensis TaxID=1820382 RepID=A0AAD5PNQ7_9CRUS|nr:vertebrate gliacolin-like protein [Daphnia sinensis]
MKEICYQKLFLTVGLFLITLFSLEVEAINNNANEETARSNYETEMLAEQITDNTNFIMMSEQIISLNNQMEEMKRFLKIEVSSIAEKFAAVKDTIDDQSSTQNQLIIKLPVLEESTNSVRKKMESIEHGLNKTHVAQKKLENSEILQSERMQANSNLYDVKQKVAFFARRNSSYGNPGSIIPYTRSHLNMGGSLNLTSGIFTVPVRGIYHFYFTGILDFRYDLCFCLKALKTKKENCGTSRITVQLIQLGTPNRMLSESHLNSNDWYGWFPVHLEAMVLLQKNDLVGVQLLEGSIHENGQLSQLTGFFGFLASEIS